MAILNGDDPLVAAMRDWTQARVMTYGVDSGHSVWADEIESFGLEGIGFDMHYGSDKVHGGRRSWAGTVCTRLWRPLVSDWPKGFRGSKSARSKRRLCSTATHCRPG